MKLYIIRHGETSWNVQRRLQGASDTDLNENGITLAKRTGEALKEIPFDLCFTSPLKRAKMTAELILAGRDISIYDDERLREISFGEWEGRDSALLPAHMLDNFSIIQRSTNLRKAGRVSGKSAQGQRIFSRSLYAGKSCRIKPCSLHPTAVLCGHFCRMFTPTRRFKISGTAVCRQTAV